MKKVISLVLAIVMLAVAIPFQAVSVSAATITVFSQRDDRWGSHSYGYSNTAGTIPTNISSGGCGILSLVNAVYYLNGNFIDPIKLADWSVQNGYRVNGVGTSHGLFPAYAKAYGNVYGFSCTSSAGVTSWSTLRSHLQSGGTAIVPVTTKATGGGHLLVIADYNSSNGTYLVLDSYASGNRGTSSGYAWMTSTTFESKMSWSKFILIYNNGSPHKVDTRYPTPFKAYTLQNAKQPAYDAVNGNNIGNIYTSDFVTIEAVYTNGWVKAKCPWDGYANDRTIYAPLSTFLNTSFTPKTIKATTKTQCYYRNDLSSSPGYIYAGDSCVQVGESGNSICVLCPWNTGGYYLVWSNKSAFAHTHSYDSWSKYDGTYHSRNCACGNVEKQAHTWNSGTVTKAATCTAAGVKTYTCTVCKATKTETIAVKDHTWDNGTVKVAATCGDNGVRTYKCSGCGGTFDQVIPATGNHTYDNACDTTCNVCNDMRMVGAHAYEGEVSTAATCGKDGVMTYTCSICGHNYTEVIPASGDHIYSSKITTAATCGSAGVKTYTCSICGDNYTEVIPATGAHTYDDDYDATCNVCGEEREVPEKPPVTPDLPADAPAFVVESTDAREGEEFTVAIRTQRNSGIVSMKLSVAYDADVLELIALEEQDFANVVFSPLSKNPFMVNWADAISPNNTTDGVVVLATFRVKEGAPLGKTEITLTYDPEDVYDENYDNVAFRVENGSVEIVDYIPGDVNADGRVNNKDLGLLQQYLSGWDVRVDEKAGDVNADGRVNNKDLGLFQQYLSGWDVELG